MPSEERRRLWHPGCEPVTDAEIVWAGGASGHRPRPRRRAGGNRRVKGEPLRLSDLAKIERVACLDVLWEMAAEIEATDDQRPRPGGKRHHGAIENLLFEFVALVEGYRGAERLLGDLHTWKRMRRAVKKRYRDRRERRLARTPITRAQNYRFHKQFFTHDIIDRLQELATHDCLKAVKHLGGLDSQAGSHLHPETTQLLTGDGTVVALAVKKRPQRCLDHDPADPHHRCDDEARSHYAIGKHRGGPRGWMAVKVLWRAPRKQHRILVDFDLRTPGRSDGTVFTDLVERLAMTHPEHLTGCRGSIYDMALEGRDCERLLSLGVTPIGKTPRRNGNVAQKNLGPHEFRLPTSPGQIPLRATLPVIAIDGAPALRLVDGNGIFRSLPLTRTRHDLRRHTRRHRFTLYVDWQIPDHPLVPNHLVGAVTTIRHNSTPQELAYSPAGRSTALRVIAEHDPDFDRLFGLREDTESSNAHLKRILRGRARGHSSRRMRLTLLAYQLLLLVTALEAHHKETGDRMSGFFGATSAAARDGPHS